MSIVTHWWREQSDPKRMDLYTRGTLYVLSAAELLLAFLLVANQRELRGVGVVALLVIAAAHTVACLTLMRAGIENFLGNRERPGRLVAVAGALTVAGIGAGLAAIPGATAVAMEQRGDMAAGWQLIMIFVGFYLLALSPLLALRSGIVIAAGMAVLLIGVAWVQVADFGRATGIGVASLLAMAAAFCSYRVSVWMLGTVWEMERSRNVEAQLAVAEERLRFSRDLHDVLGRNLSVVARKSELATQLARRGDAEAVAHMEEVRNLAESALKEVREVVRGYRTPDLDAEVAGSRSVLEAAGVRCQIIGTAAGLPEYVQQALAWVVREGTTNVLRHSEATECTVSLRSSGGAVILTMENDGVRPAGRPTSGSGLVGLAERIEAAGGRLTGEHRSGDRYRLTAEVPEPRAVRAS